MIKKCKRSDFVYVVNICDFYEYYRSPMFLWEGKGKYMLDENVRRANTIVEYTSDMTENRLCDLFHLFLDGGSFWIELNKDEVCPAVWDNSHNLVSSEENSGSVEPIFYPESVVMRGVNEPGGERLKRCFRDEK